VGSGFQAAAGFAQRLRARGGSCLEPFDRIANGFELHGQLAHCQFGLNFPHFPLSFPHRFEQPVFTAVFV
jgi:hypothetical protein